ncbi:hypothetical protein [Paraburkholderia caballeronis]|uniref:hypothetical protein n=1 Tax=Paraburkholderia caballeronis TaxID=416943 RepID=UPI0010667059|nr:hypothetical protein [Paraburkholderia caballeronis]TDV04685.1 hypothetical protein C7408_13147 [Paraburkholderia caballeronis]TDV07928.1 hypothetical protein C7406_13347 [Paraburkholderia caballeronis]TDV18219.1 hypothetical protein C7404_13147 [Paraburkholderia caballeronis]
MSEQQPQEQATPVEHPAGTPTVQPVSDTNGPKIDAWFARTFNDSPVSRDTAIYNYVRAAVNALKQEIAG